ncbi:uncharacterized protein LOC132519120 [Lagenorhynchus albirostris]|uniref:uncharacterized protein LOC132519120 n=1 Tax=Lagenorhynchus albirostris TaxID=27610 RepID=UPI0028EB2C29|nr:uncharacterized protein LOC132519120 [Lagenorhynchus albirostris]
MTTQLRWQRGAGRPFSEPWMIEAAAAGSGPQLYLLTRPEKRYNASSEALFALDTFPPATLGVPPRPDTVPSSGERSLHILYHQKTPPSIPIRASFHQGHALFLSASPQASHALTRPRSRLCHRPQPPGTLPRRTLPYPSGLPGRLGCKGGTFSPSLGDRSIPRIPRPSLASNRLAPQPPPRGCAARTSLSPHPRLPALWRPPSLPSGARSHPPYLPPPAEVPATAGSTGSAPLRPPRASLCGRRARAASRLPPPPHARTHSAQLTPGSGRKGGGERGEGAQSRGAPAPAPRGAASAIAVSGSGRRGGSECGRSPDLPEPGVG